MAFSHMKDIVFDYHLKHSKSLQNSIKLDKSRMKRDIEELLANLAEEKEKLDEAQSHALSLTRQLEAERQDRHTERYDDNIYERIYYNYCILIIYIISDILIDSFVRSRPVKPIPQTRCVGVNTVPDPPPAPLLYTGPSGTQLFDDALRRIQTRCSQSLAVSYHPR